jgi:hypothetical protein
MSFVQLSHDAAAVPPYPDSTPFVGTLRRKRANKEWTLLAAGATYSSLYSQVANADSAHVHVVVGAVPWQASTLNITFAGNAISGSYSMSTSAHGTQASGTFTGQRQ